MALLFAASTASRSASPSVLRAGGGAVRKGDTPRSEVPAVSRHGRDTSGQRALVQYDREGDMVMASSGTAGKERGAACQGMKSLVVRTDARVRSEEPEGSASSMSASLRTTDDGGGVTGNARDRKHAPVTCISCGHGPKGHNDEHKAYWVREGE